MTDQELLQHLKENFVYDAALGEFYRTRCYNNQLDLSKPAGYVTDDGYIRIEIDGASYLAHRLVHLLMLGRMPCDGYVIDHVDMNKVNNVPSNLRELPRKFNTFNIRRDLETRYKCITYDERNAYRRWYARLAFDGKQRLCKYFATFEEAQLAVDAIVNECHALLSQQFPTIAELKTVECLL